jgi:hypothetical protein
MKGLILNKISFLLMIMFLVSCSTSKKLNELKKKTESNIKVSEKGTVESVVKGDSIAFEVPNIKFKDTVIYVPSYRGTGSSLRVSYDEEGRQRIDCITSDMNTIKTYLIESEENRKEALKERLKEKETVLNSSLIIYVFLGLAFLIIINKISNKFI